MLNTPTADSGTPTTSAEEEKSAEKPSKEGNSPAGIIEYQGAVIDISSVMQKLEKSEKGRIAVESKFKDIKEELGQYEDNENKL